MGDADKTFKIAIQTTGDPSGAEVIVDALEQVEDKADETTQAVSKVPAPGAASAPGPASPSGDAVAAVFEIQKASDEATGALQGTTAATKDLTAAQQALGASIPSTFYDESLRTETVDFLLEQRAGLLGVIEASGEAGVAAEALAEIDEEFARRGLDAAEAASAQAAAMANAAQEAEEEIVSIASLTAELQRLENEMEQLPVGGQAFVELGAQIGVARAALQDARAEADAAAGTFNESGSAGKAFLASSRLAEHLQFGVQGALRGIPALVAALGGGPGLAGVVLLLGTAADIAFKKFSAADDAGEKVRSLKDTIADANAALKSLAAQEEQTKLTSLKKTFDDERTALSDETKLIVAQIDILKERLKFQGQLDTIATGAAVAGVKSNVASGKITAEAGDKQIAALQADYNARELERIKATGDQDLATFQAKLDGSKQEFQQALENKKSADDAVAAAKQAEAAYKDLLTRYQQLLAAAPGFTGGFLNNSADSLRQQQQRLSQLQPTGDSTTDAQNLADLNAIIKELARRDELNQTQAALGVPANDAGTKEIITAADKIVSAAQDHLAASLKAAQDVAGAADSSLKAARSSEDAAATALDIAHQQIPQQVAQSTTIQQATTTAADISTQQGKITAEEQKAAGKVQGLVDQILTAAGDAANDPAVQAKAAQVEQIIKDGVQDNEVNQLNTLLLQLTNSIKTTDAAGQKARQDLASQVIATLNTEQTALIALKSSLKTLQDGFTSITADVKQLQMQQGAQNR